MDRNNNPAREQQQAARSDRERAVNDKRNRIQCGNRIRHQSTRTTPSKRNKRKAQLCTTHTQNRGG